MLYPSLFQLGPIVFDLIDEDKGDWFELAFTDDADVGGTTSELPEYTLDVGGVAGGGGTKTTLPENTLVRSGAKSELSSLDSSEW